MNYYKEIRNIIHNEIGITKEDILNVIKEITQQEIQKYIEKNKGLINKDIKEIINHQMGIAVKNTNYPSVNNKIRLFDDTNKTTFEDYLVGVMTENIIKEMKNNFKINVEVEKVR